MYTRQLDRKRKGQPSGDKSRYRSRTKGLSGSRTKKDPLKIDVRESASQKKKKCREAACREAAEIIYNQYFNKQENKVPKSKKKKTTYQKRSTKHAEYFPANVLISATEYHTERTSENLTRVVHDEPSPVESTYKQYVAHIMGKLIGQPPNKRLSSDLESMVESVSTHHHHHTEHFSVHQYQTIDQMKHSLYLSCHSSDEINDSHSKFNESTNNQTNQFIESPKYLECRYNYHKTGVPDPLPIATYYLYLIKKNLKEPRYLDPRYMKSQKDITMRMRSQTIDWMMSLSEEIDLKRYTLHLAVCYLDCFLCFRNIMKSYLQLLAIAAIIMAFKFYQKAPINFVSIFESSGPKGYSRAKILDMERQLAFALKFKLYKTTLMSWTQLLGYQWDQYIRYGNLVSLAIVQYNPQIIDMDLRVRNSDSNTPLTSNYMQLVDACLFCCDMYNYERASLVLSCLYLVLRIYIYTAISGDQTLYNTYYEKFKKGTNPIFLDKYGFNYMFSEFLTPFGMELTDLINSNKFVSQFLSLDFSRGRYYFDSCQRDQDEDWLFSQTYNSSMLFYINTKL